MYQLNLPKISPKLRKDGEKLYIFDVVRRKYVRLTPEEWVRQHFISFLIDNQYPRTLFAIEKGVKYNQRHKRTDILVYARDRTPFLLVECKSPADPITENTLQQIGVYHHAIKPKNIALTNGMVTLYANMQSCHISFSDQLPKY